MADDYYCSRCSAKEQRKFFSCRFNCVDEERECIQWLLIVIRQLVRGAQNGPTTHVSWRTTEQTAQLLFIAHYLPVFCASVLQPRATATGRFFIIVKSDCISHQTSIAKWLREKRISLLFALATHLISHMFSAIKAYWTIAQPLREFCRRKLPRFMAALAAHEYRRKMRNGEFPCGWWQNHMTYRTQQRAIKAKVVFNEEITFNSTEILYFFSPLFLRNSIFCSRRCFLLLNYEQLRFVRLFSPLNPFICMKTAGERRKMATQKKTKRERERIICIFQ